MNEPAPRARLAEVFRDIIEGKTVKRAKHELLWEGREVAPLFIETLQQMGYQPLTVQRVPVSPGERVPAFYIEDACAYFGWVFWEKFTSTRQRKLFGSVVRNDRGDWDIQLSPRDQSVIYADISRKTVMDIDRPSTL
jgi:hypothetical protein